MMRSISLLIIFIALFLSLHSVVAVPYLLVDRQDDSPSSARSQAAATTDADSRTSSTPASRSSAIATQSGRSSIPTASSSIRVTASNIIQAPATTASDEPLPSSTKDANSTNPLPIKPTITPAMGLAGVILLISGIAYTIIGIKNKWLYVFFSAAYLSSLAVTVLIVYLMAPSVSNAIQGAFFVVAFLTGLIFGALALVFSDLTEGFCCLLGGFCLSMWFLTLKAGGLIGSTTGRAIFISAMSLAGYCLSFSHHTRVYGSMVSISFAGATATVLGIDCFSRAGWKEFWLYIWNLNPDIFPLFTDTYPMTKAMRAELACVVLFTVFGMISQLKLWKIVKERREKTATARLERNQQTEREGEESGRRIEDDFSIERSQWEATYGDKIRQQDSAIGSSMVSSKTSTSLKEKTSAYDSVEMVPISKGGVTKSASGKGPMNPSVTITVLQEDDIQQIDNEGNPVPMNRGLSTMYPATPNNPVHSSRNSSEGMSPNGVPRSFSTSSRRASARSPPLVVPLPFKIPQEEDAQSEKGDHDSVSAVPDSVQDSLPNNRRFSKRLSGSALKRFSANRNSQLETDSEEAMMIPHIEDDRSSLAATLDDSDGGMSLPEVSPPQSPRHSIVDVEPNAISAGVEGSPPKGTSNLKTPAFIISDTDIDSEGRQDDRKIEEEGITANNEAGLSTSTRDGIRQSLTISTNPKSGTLRSERSSLSSPTLRSGTVLSATKEDDGKIQPIGSAGPSVAELHVENFQGALPEKLSKVALSYRTNEWAKHLSTAEIPEAYDVVEPASPGVQLDPSSDERAVPVSDEILQPLMAQTASRRVSTESNVHQNSNLIHSNSNFSSTSQIENPHSLSRTPSGLASGAVSPLPVALSPKPSSTLMGKRESLIRNRVSTQSFTPLPTKLAATAVDQENMTLAQRRRLLQQPRAPSASQQWRQSSQAIQEQGQPLNSRPTKRASSSGLDQTKREVALAGWRESIRQDGAVTPVQTRTVSEENRRAAMLNERRNQEMEKQKRELAKQQRESVMDMQMRSGAMLEAHRDAMRRMQASANKKL